MKCSLIGNPNVGKTTIFNILTGSNQKIGNYPGVTVQKKVGKIKDNIELIDLPGIYSLDSLSIEEKISLEYLKTEKPDLIINVIDSSNLYRNLFLTLQLKSFNIPMILVLNMIDIAEKNNIIIDTNKLSLQFNCKIFAINGNKKSSTKSLKNFIENYQPINIKNDEINKDESYDKIYEEIDSILKSCLKNNKYIGKNKSEYIDKIILNKYLSLPILIIIFYLVFKITFSWVGGPLSDIFSNLISNKFIPTIENLLLSSSNLTKSFILDGIISAVSTIISFLPIILSMFICLTFLESCGYIARSAVLLDRFMGIFGLSGKAFLPMLMSFGCTVPAIMATRTFENDNDRKTSIFLLPLISCSARLPVFLLFTNIFFKEHREIVILFLYVLSIILAIIIGLIMKSFSKKNYSGEVFILELPNYKLPSLSYIFKESLNKISSFFKKIGTLILSISIIIWFLSNFNIYGFCSVEDSFLYSIGTYISKIFIPLGFGFWQAAVSLITGLMAKEFIISSMGVAFGLNLHEILPTFFSVQSSISFLVFVLLYTPCISVLSTVKHEYGMKLTIILTIYQFLLAYSVSFFVFNIINLFW
ncbi:Ferrous iron transport protein B [Candidatus Arthromitus sp. SFB-mouse-NL]|uniref:ferrous iron transporter B n=1 Tax=Candidatus Arthromitus sp. SFB-mouse-NL TaxID=1508644 RepID=UPI00049ADD02|nr:ferrous iron transporter B [Candidatus Arthromitus sp. SFB-mouse-NL]AID45188.1 Ferrous iron transport protein B [Candidatus Arthromitus sp. SFB-mouse-NL]